MRVKLKILLGVKRKDFRGKKAKGGLMGELNRPDRGYKSGGFIARGVWVRLCLIDVKKQK